MIAAAVHDTGYNGREVVFVVENRNLLYHLQEAPMGRKSLIRGFLERRVAQSRFFDDEPAAFGVSHPILVKNSQRFLLTLLPRKWLLNLREGCAAEGLQLTGVFSPASVLARHLNQLPVDPGQQVMMTTDLGGTLCLMVGRKEKESQVLFARTVTVTQAGAAPADGVRGPAPLRVVRPGVREGDRLEQELNRTRLFSQQQFEASISQLWVLGAGAQSALAETRLPDGVSSHFAPLEEEVFFLAREASHLTNRSAGNLLGQISGQEVEQRRLVAMAMAAGLVLSAGVAGWTTHVAHARELEVQTLEAQTAEAKELNQEAIRLWELTSARQLLVSSVGTQNDPPIPLLVLRYFGARLPDPFVLNRLEINRSSNRWQVKVEGRQTESSEGFLAAVQSLEDQLTNSPFKLQIISSTRSRIFQESDAESRTIPTTAGQSEGERPFFVEAIIP